MRILELIKILLIVFGCFLVVGTAGADDLGTITDALILKQLLTAVIMFVLAFVVAIISKKYR